MSRKGTDGEINAFSLVVLEDDKDFLPTKLPRGAAGSAGCKPRHSRCPQRTGSQANRRHDATPQLRGKRKQREPAEVAKNFDSRGC